MMMCYWLQVAIEVHEEEKVRLKRGLKAGEVQFFNR